MGVVGKKPHKPAADGYIRKQIRRGFRKLSWIDEAKRELLRLDEEDKQASLKRDLPDPDTVFDLYDLHPYSKHPDPDKRWHRPYQLEPYISILETACDVRVRVLLSAPPQHEKSMTGLMLMAFHLLKHRGLHHFFVSYNGTRARAVCGVFCDEVLKPLGIPFEQANGVVSCLGSTVQFAGLKEGITGYTCTGLMLLDDLVKNAEEGRSVSTKEKIWTGFSRDISSRERGSMSVVVVMTRWDTDDLVGRLLKAEPDRWTYLNFKAVCESTEDDPLHRDVGAYLLDSQQAKVDEARERSERDYWCMYQGEPSVPGLRLFHEPQTYTVLPLCPMVTLYGLDSAYAGKRRSDWSVCWRGLWAPSLKKLYVTNVIRVQENLGSFGDKVTLLQKSRPGPILWLTGGQEAYAPVDVLKSHGVRRLTCINATGNPAVRASKCADAVNSGMILFPAHRDEQMELAIEEITLFSGDPKKHDDCVSGLDALYRLTLQNTTGVAFKQLAPTPGSEDVGKRTEEQSPGAIKMREQANTGRWGLQRGAFGPGF